MQEYSHSLPSRSFLSRAEGEVRLGLSHGVGEEAEGGTLNCRTVMPGIMNQGLVRGLVKIIFSLKGRELEIP